MDFSVSESATELGARFDEWIGHELPDAWRDVRAGSVDEEHYATMRREWGALLHAGGWSAPSWPTEYGGLGLSVDEQLVYLSRLVAAGAPEPLNTNPIGVLGPCLMRYGTPEQRSFYLEKMLSHELIGCQGFSEPDAGSDLAGLRTRGTPADGGFIVTGQKVWTTNAHVADFCYALVRTDPDSQRTRGITMLLIDMRSPGVEVRPLVNIAGTAEFNEVYFTDVFVPQDAVVGEVGDGWAVAMYALAEERTTGIAQRALRLRRDLENVTALYEDRVGDAPAVDASAWAAELATIAVDTRAVEAAVYRNLALSSQGGDISVYSPMAIYSWSAAHQRIRRLALDILGDDSVRAVGVPNEWNRSTLFARSASIAGGTTEVQLNNIAKGLGLPSSRAS